ncbi:MAG: hypothetical protein CK424_03920 [Legionella sp.]|nr:MAG: hypothetical protein CK424_03920 [Legionella sp.]
MANLSFSHTYEASWVNFNKVTIIKKDVTFELSLGETPAFDLQVIFPHLDAFTSDEIERINTLFDAQRINFVKKIIDMKPLHTAIFSNDRYITKDLLALIDMPDDPELIQALETLKEEHPFHANSQTKFREYYLKHTEGVLNFTRTLSARPAFQTNMTLLYLSIALDYKTQREHWLNKKETYASLSAILLKLPVAIIDLSAVMLIVMGTILFCLIPLVILILLSCAELSVMTAFSIIAPWIALLILGLKFDILQSMKNGLDYAVGSVALWIDRGVQALFGVEFFAFELSKLLAKMNPSNVLDANGVSIAMPAEAEAGADAAESEIFFNPRTQEYLASSWASRFFFQPEPATEGLIISYPNDDEFSDEEDRDNDSVFSID